MSKTRDILPGNELWRLIMKLYKEGRSLSAIGRHPRIQKDHTTVLYHIRKAGLKNRRDAADLDPYVTQETARKHFYKPRKQEAFGPDRCQDCGVKFEFAPNHNCKPGHYYTQPIEDRFGHSFSD